VAATTDPDWSVAFRRSTVHPAVFAVRDRDVATELLTWAAGRPLAHRHQAYAFSAELDGWALLDGGLSYLQSRARGRLRSGLRVIGWGALRYLAAQLALVPPRRLLVGESGRRSDDDLHRLAQDGWVVAQPPARQATMLVSYVDARGLNEVACTLAGASAARPQHLIKDLWSVRSADRRQPTRDGGAPVLAHERGPVLPRLGQAPRTS
jgi:hypothetical protein